SAIDGTERAQIQECAPDGSPVDAFALLPPGPGPALIDSVLPREATVLELGCGAGRLLAPLVAAGHTCAGVDQSPEMLARAPAGIETHLADIETVDLTPRRFDAAVLASFLVNTPDGDRRRAYLASARRHSDVVVVQRLDPELVPGAVDAVSEEDGVRYEMAGVRHTGDLFAATMRFTIDGTTFEHHYEGLVLDDTSFAATVATIGLRVDRYLDGQRTWAVLR
ncbi:MAG TPA: class I SAM-dependent methyltransferase, partial [Acidimicrobiales bacterium]